jgi:hypothetical protein
MRSLVEEVSFQVGATGPIEWEIMSVVVGHSLVGAVLGEEFLPNEFESIDPFDDDGTPRIATDLPTSTQFGVAPGDLIIPDYDDTEAVDSFAEWFDETFTTDPDGPYYVYVEKPAEAYRQLLYESLEFCEAEPDLCGNTLEELDRTE